MGKLPLMKKSGILLIALLIGFSCAKEDDQSIDEPMEIPATELLHQDISLELNPSGNAPLAALAIIQTLEPTSISLSINGKMIREFQTPQSRHTLPVLGLKPGIQNQLVFTVKQSDSRFAKDTLMLETEPLPDYMPNVHILQQKVQKMEPGFTLCELSYGKNGQMIARPFIFDQNGYIRWYLSIESINNFINPVKRLENGNWVFGLDRFIYEYDMLGFEVKQWELDGYGQHHDIVELPNGNLLIAATKKDLQTIEDHIIELDRNTGIITKVWDLRQIMDNDRFDLVWNSRDWLHVNSLWYDESDGSILISARHQAIFKITPDNHLIWILAPHTGWGNAGINSEGKPTEEFLLQAVNAAGTTYVSEVQQGLERALDFDWPWGQHDASLLPNGHILAFDNGFNRWFQSDETELHARGVEYAIDENTGRVRQVWEFGQQLGPAFYSRNLGSAGYLPQTGNRLLCSGNIHYNGFKRAKIIEITVPESEVVFEANINFANLHSTGVDAWGQTDMVYRCTRLSLYP